MNPSNSPPAPDQPATPQDLPSDQIAIRWRAIFIGAALALAICALTPFNNAYRQGTPLGGGHFPLAPFYFFIWMMIITALMAKLFKGRRMLTGKELLVAWALMVLLSGIAWTGLARTFFINLTAPFGFATVENRWEDVLHPLMPVTWYPQNLAAVDGFQNGLPDGRYMGWLTVLQQIPWESWVRPLITWTGFVLLCYVLMACIVSLLSKQSITHERMNFPLLRVPLLMADAFDDNALGKLFLHRFFLIGLLIPVCLHLLNGLSFYNPSIPAIPTSVIAGKYFPEHGLFSGFGKLKIFIYPAFIGFAFLTSKQISFSFWLFFIAGALFIGALSFLGFNIPSASLGITFGPTISRPEEMQMVGAYVVFFLFLAWLARFHFFDIAKRGVGLKPGGRSGEEWIPTPLAFWGTVLCSIGLVIWCHYFGIPVVVSLLVVGAFFLFMLVALRIICQGGLAYFTLTAAPLDGLMAFIGPKAFTHVGILVAAVMQKVLFVDLRESLMPSLLHARKVTSHTKHQRRIFISILILLAAGIVVSFVSFLALCYKFGARELGLDWATRTTLAVYDNVFSMVESPATPGAWPRVFVVVGALVMLALVICYHRFYWWPIHPIGYLTAYSSALWYLWFSFFIGWACNSLCMRYGGVLLFKKVRYLFIGLIVGDFLMAGSWALYGLFSDFSYTVLPV